MTPEERARHTAEAAERVRRVAFGLDEPPKGSPPRSAFRSNARGQRAWLDHVEKGITRDLERYADLDGA
jgi:hypothetical protein